MTEFLRQSLMIFIIQGLRTIVLILIVIVNGIRTGDSPPTRGLNKGHGSKFRVVSRVQHETPEEGWKTYWLKLCEYNNEDEDNSLKILNDKFFIFYNTILSHFCDIEKCYMPSSIQTCVPLHSYAQSAGAVEYNDCTSAEG